MEATAAELATLTGRRIVPLTVDTSSKVSVDRMVKQAIAALGGIDILVNAAALPGGISSASRLDEIDDAQAIEDIDIKVIGYLRTARALAP
ncbi:SDR family NAD(P)-dependent oxidoreductase, partial [Acinetobacter baumannii]